jgi:hypothetical protein
MIERLLFYGVYRHRGSTPVIKAEQRTAYILVDLANTQVIGVYTATPLAGMTAGYVVGIFW